MKTGRNIIISAFLALGVAGSVAAVTVPAVAPAVTASAPSTWYHG